MPFYTSNGQAQLIHSNQTLTLINTSDGVPTASAPNGALSVAFQLDRISGAYYPWGFAVEVAFSGPPGTFEIDVMGAETDTRNNYCKLGSISAVNANNAGRFEGLTYYPKFVAINTTTLTNAVTMTARLTR